MQGTLESTQNTRESPQDSHRLPAECSSGKVTKVCMFNHVRSRQLNELEQFNNVNENKLARFLHRSKTSLQYIDNFFKYNLVP